MPAGHVVLDGVVDQVVQQTFDEPWVAVKRRGPNRRFLAQRGDLEVDPETDSSGLRFVTRTSVKAYWIAYHEAKRRPAQPVTALPLAEVARFTGHSTRELMDLVRVGVLDQVPGRRAVQLTAPSLRAWMAERDVPTRTTTSDPALLQLRPAARTTSGLLTCAKKEPGRFRVVR